MKGVSCAGGKKSSDMGYRSGYLCMPIPWVWKQEVLDHTASFFEVYFDRQHNKVVERVGTEARLPGSPAS